MAGGGAIAASGRPMIPVAGRILVLAPHPDDEIVACAHRHALCDRSRRARLRLAPDDRGAPSGLLWSWERAAYRDRVWRRQEEALDAARLLGI